MQSEAVRGAASIGPRHSPKPQSEDGYTIATEPKTKKSLDLAVCTSNAIKIDQSCFFYRLNSKLWHTITQRTKKKSNGINLGQNLRHPSKPFPSSDAHRQQHCHGWQPSSAPTLLKARPLGIPPSSAISTTTEPSQPNEENDLPRPLRP